jgi:hypothetical protein
MHSLYVVMSDDIIAFSEEDLQSCIYSQLVSAMSGVHLTPLAALILKVNCSLFFSFTAQIYQVN